ncbi:MAG: aminotransferase class I/II-fold pyridoxal phosphate-dependent enzyme [Acidobacteriales bacterium]|nr:aminotransferase class I/II-fold pyridoxal phosphate-dependent enzyme [Terriglobales bacterium]
MCYIFKSLKANRLLHPGDTIALGTPIFTPYLEMTHLEDYDLKTVEIKAPQENCFQYTDAEIKKLEDPNIKAFFIVNPGNPTGMGMSKETIAKITTLVKTKRPDLMLLTDDVYGTFVDDFRSLLGELPPRIPSGSIHTRSILAVPGGGSVSSPFTKITSLTR